MLKRDLVLCVLAGLAGALGVALAAAAAHTGASPNLATASQFLLLHAAAVVAVAGSMLTRETPLLATLAASMLLFGSALFSGELALGALYGMKLFPMAAPTGGMLMILGWLCVAVAAGAGLIRRGRM